MSTLEITETIIGIIVFLVFYRQFNINQEKIDALSQGNTVLKAEIYGLTAKNKTLELMLKKEVNHSIAMEVLCRSMIYLHGKFAGINDLEEKFSSMHEVVLEDVQMRMAEINQVQQKIQ